jgi:transmembrane sensor
MLFYRPPLVQVIADVNHYHPGRIVLLNPHLRDLPVSGVFHTTSPDTALTTVERTLQVHTTRLTSRLILLYYPEQRTAHPHSPKISALD